MVCTIDLVSDKAKTAVPRSSDDRDGQIVGRFRKGDTAAFEELVARHQSRLMRLIGRLLDSRQDAEDVLQEVFVSVFENLSRFRGRASFSTWTTTIAVNKCRTHRRRVARRRRLIQLLRGKPNGVAEYACHDLEEGEEVRLAVRALPPKYREPVVLYYFEQMSVAEISNVLRRKPNTIDARLSRARRMLREVLNRQREPILKPGCGRQ